MAIETKLVSRACPRCGGTGAWGFYGYTCFGCNGTGNAKPKRVAANPAEQPALDAQRERARERAREKREAEKAAAWEKNCAAYPVLREAETYAAETGEPLWHVAADILDKARKYTISAKQAAVITKALERAREKQARLAEREAEAATRTEAPEGRVTFTATVEWAGWKNTGYGEQRKIRVLAEDGWAGYGTAPVAIEHVEAGDTIRLTATLKPTDDDPTFAWLSRPAKAEILEAVAA
jgi:hypothetical protein